MDFDFTEEQIMLRDAARDFLKTHCAKDAIRMMEESEDGYSPELWSKMAELGWMGLIIPEKHGGAGMSYLDLMVLLEEMGRNILPGPFFSTVVLGTIPILDYGTDEQKAEYLPQLAEGEIKMALALNEPGGSFAASGIMCKAKPDGDDYILEGTKLFVENANIADYLICVARTEEGANLEKGITLFIVKTNSPDLEIQVIPTMAHKLCEVNFKSVRVPKKNILGQQDQGWEALQKILQKASVAKCAEMVGGIQACLDMTAAYAMERVTYGQFIGSYQVIQHYLSNLWIAMETSKNITYLAAWKVNEGLPAGIEASAAKAYVGEAYTKVAERCVHIHGAMGLTWEHDIGLYYRYAKASDLAFGDGNHQKNLIAAEMGF